MTARVAYIIRITQITLKFIHKALLVYMSLPKHHVFISLLFILKGFSKPFINNKAAVILNFKFIMSPEEEPDMV